MTKIIAMYLPQYHIIKENDQWWGKGFTEWTNVKRATPLFEGHLQPRIPQRYYDLSDPNEMLNQMKMARDYGVDGFAFYHYWFDGRLLLEKPVEVLRNYESTPIDYCLCWANESWNRRWNNEEKEILIKQRYGGKKEWSEHYVYFSTFFKKKNYLKKNNCPIIIIYNKRVIPCIKEMYELWDDLAKKEGYNGLHIIEVHRSKLLFEVPFYGNAVMRFEPFATFHEMPFYTRESISKGHWSSSQKKIYKVIDYEKFCKLMIKQSGFSDENQYLGFFTGWDNSPRIGGRASLLFDNNTPDIFEKYFEVLFKNSICRNNEYLFINAWNEWGEGTFLEPDKEYGYGYLESIKKVKSRNA